MKLQLSVLLALPSFPAQDPAASPLEPNGASRAPSLSDDGQFIVFESRASNLVAGKNKRAWDVFCFERATGRIVRISDERPLSARWASISGDARWIAFLQEEPSGPVVGRRYVWKETETPWRVGLHDRAAGSTQWIGETLTHAPSAPSISRDGSKVVFESRKAGVSRVQLYDRRSGKLEVVSTANDGTLPVEDARNPSISRDARFLVFTSCAPNIATTPSMASTFDTFSNDSHVFIRDLETREVSYGSRYAYQQIGYAGFEAPLVSDGGRYVAFDHQDPRKLGSTHVGFVSDVQERDGGRLLPVERKDWWQGAMTITWLSSNGRRALVESWDADNPRRIPPRGCLQVHLRDLGADTWTLLSRGMTGGPGNRSSWGAAGSDDGSTYAFTSDATDFVDGDTNRRADVFVVDAKTWAIRRIGPTGQ